MFTFADVWSYTIPTQKEFEVTRPEVFDKVAAFFVKKGEKKIKVEFEHRDFRNIIVYVDGKYAGFFSALHIREGLLNICREELL